MVCMTLGAQAVTVLQDGTVGRIYKSAPTVCGNFIDEWVVCAIAFFATTRIKLLLSLRHFLLTVTLLKSVLRIN